MRLVVDSLSKRFGGLNALSGVSFTAEDQKITGLIGPNGAGKTTLFNCVSGFYRPDEGTVELGGRSMHGLRPSSVLQAGLARTFQLVRPFHGLTVLETVMTAGHWRSGQGLLASMAGLPRIHKSEERLRSEAVRTLHALDIAHLADSYTHELPYGQQRLVEIAKVLATGAQTLLLDEPAAGLHETEVDSLAVVVRGIRDAGRTLLIVEHNMPFILGLADHVVVLDFGKVTAAGTPQEVSENPAVIESYLGKVDEHA